MNRTNFILGLIVVAALSVALSGCGGGEDDEPTQAPAAEQPTKRPTPVDVTCATTVPMPAACGLVKPQ